MAAGNSSVLIGILQQITDGMAQSVLTTKQHYLEQRVKYGRRNPLTIESKMRLVEAMAKRDRFLKAKALNECEVCLDQAHTPITLDCCQKLICGACITKIGSQCPYCRGEISQTGSRYALPTCEVKTCRSVLTTLLNDLRRKGDKVLLFCTDTAKNLNFVNSYRMARLSGQATFIQKMVARFHLTDGSPDQLDFLVLDSNINVAGLNLPTTTAIVFAQPMPNAGTETQAIGRALREYTRDVELPLTIYRLKPVPEPVITVE
jgi:hypothetical protein